MIHRYGLPLIGKVAGIEEFASVVEPHWPLYARYCREREAGLRQQSLRTLDAFIAAMVLRDRVERRRFVSVVRNRERIDGNSMLTPEPLLRFLVAPTLEEWIAEDPGDIEPLLLMDNEDHLRRAVALFPDNVHAAHRLARHLLGWLCDAMHELPSGLLIDVEEARTDIEEAQRLLSIGTDCRPADLWDALIDYDTVIASYEAWRRERASGETACFANWCERRGRRGRAVASVPRIDSRIRPEWLD